MCGEVECVATTVCVLGRCGGVYLPKCSAGSHGGSEGDPGQGGIPSHTGEGGRLKPTRYTNISEAGESPVWKMGEILKLQILHRLKLREICFKHWFCPLKLLK